MKPITSHSPDCPDSASGGSHRAFRALRICVVSTLLALGTIAVPAADSPAPSAAASSAHTWQRWEHALTSSRDYHNPYADVTVRIRFTGPGGRALDGLGFWDGGDVFRFRCAFPAAGAWEWKTDCSDRANLGLHSRSGIVEVAPYGGENPLYRRGFLKVSDDRRYLTLGDGTPFLWVGDTAWAVPMRATEGEWEEYLADRREKHFTLLQVCPASEWSGKADRQGELPFHDQACFRLNPAFWQAFERKFQRANEAGLAMALVGLMEPVRRRFPSTAAATLFAQHIVARLFGNFVIFSPSFDSDFTPLANEVGWATRGATAVHLITQHPGTPSREPTPTITMKYYDQSYLDIAGVQSGHNQGNRERCAHHASEWILHAYRHQPHKPVINLEAMYDGQGDKTWQAVDARSAAWRSWLSGAMGYTYGAGDVPPKVPQGNGGLWKWVIDPEKPDYWRKALQWESAAQMRYLHDFLAAIEWWRLEPAPELIRHQPEVWTRRMVLARIPARDQAVAYLPDNEWIDVDLSAFSGPLSVRWFDPVLGRYDPVQGIAASQGVERLTPPVKGEWVLVLGLQIPSGRKP